MKTRRTRNPAAAPAPASPTNPPATLMVRLDQSPESIAIRAAAALDLEDDPDPPPFDITSFDPDDYEWRPVLRRPRADGWLPDVQRKFIETLADTGLVSAACEAVDMSVQSAYRLRRAPGSESFARAWDAAVAAAATRLVDVAFSRAIEGVDTPVFDRDGCRIGSKRAYSDRLLMFLLRSYRPEQFRHGEQDVRRASEAPTYTALPVDRAVDALGPPTPADPHRLMAPDRLAGLVESAIAVGEVYERHLAPDHDRERYVHPRVERDHPKSTDRARRRRQREFERWEDEAE